MTNSDAVILLMNSEYYKQGYNQGVSDVLDKIKAEIEATIGEHNLDDYDFCSGLIYARKIIDKYRADKEQET